MSSVLPCLTPPAEVVAPDRLGEPLLDDYLDFLAVRCRPNSVMAARFDLKVFFEVVAKSVAAVSAADVLGFITAQRTGARCLPEPGVRAAPTDPVGVCSRTIRRRLLSDAAPVTCDRVRVALRGWLDEVQPDGQPEGQPEG